MEPHKLTKRELEVYEKLNLDKHLRRIRENHWGDTNLPPRSPEFTKRIEQALSMQIPPSPVRGTADRGAIEVLNAVIKSLIPPWYVRIRSWRPHFVRRFANWLLRITE
jgi:hypothetical protein